MKRDNDSPSVEAREYDSWPTVDEESLSSEDRRIFLRRKTAVKRKIDGDRNQSIENITGLSRQEVNRFLKRCRSSALDGRIWGWRILVPGTWQSAGKRKKLPQPKGQGPGGLAYAFSWLLDTYPDIRGLVTNLFIGKADKGEVPEVGMMKKDIHQAMLAALRKKGLTDYDYPFSTKDKGLRSLEKFLDDLYDRYFRKIVKNYSGDDKARKMGEGAITGEPPAQFPNQQMEVDAHQLDGLYDLSLNQNRYPPKSGSYNRPWLLVLIDRYTLVVWAYLIVLAVQVTQYDILRLFKRFIGPWQFPQITDDRLRIREGGGLPKDIFPDCEYPLADEIYFDNALAHLAFETVRIVTDLNGGTLISGPFKNPNMRPYIESFFKGIAQVSHRLPNTTGSYPGDPLRKSPEEAAKRYQMDFNFLSQLLATIFANYNATKHSSLGNMTPLQMLHHSISLHPLRMLLNPDDLMKLNLTKTVTVRGDKQEGRRPYIQYEHVRYSSESLGKTPSLLGKKLTLSIDFDNLHIIAAYLDNGHFFDFLIPKDRRWQRSHTLEERKLFFRHEGTEEVDDYIHDLVSTLPLVPQPTKTLPKKGPRSKEIIFKPLSRWTEDDGRTTSGD